MLSTKEREACEIDFWTQSSTESPESDSVDNLINKLAEARVLLEKLRAFNAEFAGARRILEIGGGQLWSSCIVKRLFPDAMVVGTDIAPDAIASAHIWEHIFNVRLEATKACRSNQLPFPDESFDLVFAYAAAHHFADHAGTLAEIARVLCPGGRALYLHEPACPAFIYPLAVKRVTSKRPVVPEDVLVYTRISRLARTVGLSAERRFDVSIANRGPLETIYYALLRRVPTIRHLLPCGADMIFRKSRP